MYHYIYKVLSESGKYYIGRHSTKNLEDNYMGSGKWVRSLHDRTHLTKEVIEFCDSFDTLRDREKFHINEHINNPLCMNFNNESIGFATGDLNPGRSDSERKRRSERATTNNPSKNREVARKISDALRGKPNPRKGIPLSDTACRNISDGRKGIKYSDEGKEKISQARSRDYYSGKRGVPSFSGLTHSDETKIKQSQSALNRKRVKCPYCDKEGAVNTMVRWHFDNCKNKKETKMELTAKQFATLFPRAQDPQSWVDSMNAVFPNYQINTPQRVAAFLAQCGHESGGWTVFEENLNYSAKGLNGIFKKYFPTLESAMPYERKPEMIANKIYANRMGNGSPESGDGWKYRGRGPIQLTGRSNYTAFAKDMFEDWQNVVENPDWVTSDKDFALMSAIWFWNKNGLNKEADAGDIKTMTRKINGGYIGLDDRIKHYNEAIHLLT